MASYLLSAKHFRAYPSSIRSKSQEEKQVKLQNPERHAHVLVRLWNDTTGSCVVVSENDSWTGWVVTYSREIHSVLVPLQMELMHFFLKVIHQLFRILDRVLAAFAVLFPPATNAFFFLVDAVLLDLNLLAELASLRNRECAHHQAHAACLAGAVLFGTMRAEVAPLIIEALELVLIVEAHGSWWILYKTEGVSPVGTILKQDAGQAWNSLVVGRWRSKILHGVSQDYREWIRGWH